MAFNPFNYGGTTPPGAGHRHRQIGSSLMSAAALDTPKSECLMQSIVMFSEMPGSFSLAGDIRPKAIAVQYRNRADSWLGDKLIYNRWAFAAFHPAFNDEISSVWLLG